MNTELEALLDAWVANPTDKLAAQAMISAVKDEKFQTETLVYAITHASWHKTAHASQWTRLFMDAIVCAGFHKSDAWWSNLVSGLPNQRDIRCFPIIVARQGVKHVEACWEPHRPSSPAIRATQEMRSKEGLEQSLNLLSQAPATHPVTLGVLGWIASFPDWSSPAVCADVMGIAAQAWPSLTSVAHTVSGMFDTALERVTQFGTMASAAEHDAHQAAEHDDASLSMS